MTTPSIGMPELTHKEYNGEVTHNAALRFIDFHLQPIIITRTQAEAPATPTSGDAYIRGSGVWDGGVADNIAHYYEGTWYYYVPKRAWQVIAQDDFTQYLWDGSNWITN